MDGINIYKKIRLKDPYLITAWPGMGEVAYKAASYLIEKLEAKEIAEIKSENFFYLTGSIIQDGILQLPELPFNKFYYWKNPSLKRTKNDLLIFLSNAQPDLAKAEDYSKLIIKTAKLFGVKRVISFAAMPQPIDHNQQPQVWFSSTSLELNNLLKNYNLNLMSEGQISGMNGLFLALAKKEDLEGFCLLGEIPLYTIQIENPKASYAVLKVLSKILDISIDFTALVEQIRIIEDEINKLFDYLKLGSSSPGPIGEEEIEKIKKSLSQLTKLPLSVKEKIEKLFEQAKHDISKATQLKAELDKWNVYKEYEDRFLDLFKKPKDNQ